MILIKDKSNNDYDISDNIDNDSLILSRCNSVTSNLNDFLSNNDLLGKNIKDI